MSEKNYNSYVNLDNARTDEQRNVMEAIEERGECPFCPENVDKYHKQPIIRRGDHWLLTNNQWPYEFTDQHLLAIAAYHVETIPDLREGAFEELQEHMSWAILTYKIAVGGLTMRFGDVSRNGATVRHLHAHLIVPAADKPPEEKVRFKIS